MAQQYNPTHLSEEAICSICNQTIYWTIYRFPKTLPNNSIDSIDDKFDNVRHKLKHHQLNDKSCVREQKLNQLLDYNEKF